jgi:hypothetical protein
MNYDLSHDRKLKLCIGAAAICAFGYFHSPAFAHDTWQNGQAVPAWVKSACCGPSDVHHLTSTQVHAMPDGWHIDGIGTVVPYSKELPSQDGDYWGFWPPWATNVTDKPPVFCFFAPPQGS